MQHSNTGGDEDPFTCKCGLDSGILGPASTRPHDPIDGNRRIREGYDGESVIAVDKSDGRMR